MAFLAVLISFLLISLTPSQARPAQSFDFYYFVQQWPGSYCNTRQGCCYPSTGKPAVEFSIHGLWPNYDDGSYPASCSASAIYDPSLVSDLKDELQMYWDTLACPRSDGAHFWSHEWTKHGTCTGLDQHAYFQAALNLRQNIDLLGALQKAEIEADGKSYKLSDIEAALTQGIGQRPGLECNADAAGNEQLYQVYVCVDKDAATVIECPVLPRSRCGSEVTIPAFDDMIQQHDDGRQSHGHRHRHEHGHAHSHGHTRDSIIDDDVSQPFGGEDGEL